MGKRVLFELQRWWRGAWCVFLEDEPGAFDVGQRPEVDPKTK